MIYVTITTRNRFWHSALCAWSIAQKNWNGCFVHVLDDASDDQYADNKRYMFEDLINQGVIHRYERVESRIGFCAGRARLIDRFLQQTRFDTWFHFDDDILFDDQMLRQVTLDLTGLCRRGMLHAYVNPWTKWTADGEDFGKASKIGWACFAIPKTVQAQIGNPYQGKKDGEKANADFANLLKSQGFSMFVRIRNPYLCQHIGNTDSVIFGRTPQWESLYAVDQVTKKPLEVPPHDWKILRAAIRRNELQGYVWLLNSKSDKRIKLPPLPTS